MPQIYIPQTQEEKNGIARWMQERLKEPIPDKFETIAVIHDDKLAAAMLYYDYFGNSINLSLVSDSPRCASKTVFKVMLGYPFKQLGVNRVTAMIRKKNRRSRKLAEGLGFRLEGVMRKADPDGRDLCVYGITKDDYLSGRFV